MRDGAMSWLWVALQMGVAFKMGVLLRTIVSDFHVRFFEQC